MSQVSNATEKFFPRTIPFISRLTKDAESDALDQQIYAYTRNSPDRLYFSWREFERHEYRGGRLGKAEKETVARQLLLFSSRVSRTVGVPEEEFHQFLASGYFYIIGCDNEEYLPSLTKNGDIRRANIAGVAILFPTEQLLRVYRCGVSKDSALIQAGMRACVRGTFRKYDGGVEICDLNCRVLAKRAGGSAMQEIISQNHYAALESIPRNAEEDRFFFLFLGSRIIRLADAERAEWLGELLHKERIQASGLPCNAFERYLGDSAWSFAATTFRQESNTVFIASVA